MVDLITFLISRNAGELISRGVNLNIHRVISI